MNFDQLQPDKKKEIERKVQIAWDAASCSDKWIAPFDIVFEKVKGVKDIDTLEAKEFVNQVIHVLDQFYLIAVREMNKLDQTKTISRPIVEHECINDAQKHSLGDAIYIKTNEIYTLHHIDTRSGKRIYGSAFEK